MSTDMNVSIILPTYNRAYVLPEAIRSVLNQTYTNFELIVIDDGSMDNTAEVVAAFADPRVRLVPHDRNHGYAAALNTGLNGAVGDVLAFIDSDDLWIPGKLELQLNSLRENPSLGGVFSLEWIEGRDHGASMEDTATILKQFPRFRQLLGGREDQGFSTFSKRQIYVCMLAEMPVKLVASVLRRDRVEHTGRFLETWKSGPDWEFLLRFARSNDLGFVNRAVTIRRILPDSTLVRFQKADAACLLERFIKEKLLLKGDRESLEAVRQGIAHHAKELGWQQLREGESHAAAATYWRGFLESRDAFLLLRVLAATLPLKVRIALKYAKQGLAG